MTTVPYATAYARWLHLSARHQFPELNGTTREEAEAAIEHEVPPGRYTNEDGHSVLVIGIAWDTTSIPRNPMVVMEKNGALTVCSLYTGPASFLHPEGPRYARDPDEPTLRVA